ncbi:MAG TPA: protein translocase subunit SecD [Ktedonobacterales bacterium]|jgi:preprotein translocase subunit SecD
MRRGTLIFLLAIVLLGAGAVFVDLAWTPLWPGNHGINFAGYKNELKVHEGLDLQGGIQFVLQASCPSSKPDCSSSYISSNMSAVVDNVTRRINGGLGVNEPVVRTEGGNRVLVELPGLQDDAQASALLGSTGQMNIIDTGTTQLNIGDAATGCTTKCAAGQYKIVFTGSELNLNAIQAGLDSQTNQPIVTFAFTGSAKGKFATYTRDHVGQFLTVTLDDKVIESATIQSEIDGNGQITGIPSVAEAQNLASLLKYGALPLPLKVISESHLSATLGQQAIQFSLRAALIGLGMVMFFMLIYYRLPGLLADVALLFYAAFTFAVIKLLGVTLSLAGIAGVVLSIGMAVDANVLIFERVKEELRSGRTMAAAIDIGFKRAWPSIRDSNASTMITCAILYWFGSNFGASIIVGFATNLFIGVAISLFTAVVVTRNFLNVLVPTGIATHPALYGLPLEALNVARYNPSRSRLASANGGARNGASNGLADGRTRAAIGAGARRGAGSDNGDHASNGVVPAAGAAEVTGAEE